MSPHGADILLSSMGDPLGEFFGVPCGVTCGVHFSRLGSCNVGASLAHGAAPFIAFRLFCGGLLKII